MNGFARLYRPGWAQVRPLLIGGAWLLFVAVFYFWHLGTQTPGLGPDEYLSRQNSQNSTTILNQGFNAPYLLLQQFLAKIHLSGAFGLRLASVLFGLVIFIYLLILLRTLFGRTITFFGGLIFLSTPWMVLAIRTAGPNVMLLWPLVLLACFLRLNRSKGNLDFAWLLFCAAIAIGLYTPGIIWFLLGAAVFVWRQMASFFKRISFPFLISGMVGVLIIVAPLILSIINEPSHLKTFFLIPDKLPRAIESLKSIGLSAVAYFWHTRAHIDIGLGRLPVLNIMQVALCALGIYGLAVKARRLTYLLLGLLLLAIVAAGLNENAHFLLFGLPSVGLFIAAGLRYLLLEWRRVFPLNPFAKSLALILISAVVVTQLLYSARYVLAAWPNSEATKSTYVLK